MTTRERLGRWVIGVAMAAVVLFLPRGAAAQCCDKVCNPDGSSTRCGNVVNGLANPITGCVQAAPAVQNDPSKPGLCLGGTMLAGMGAPNPPVLIGCGCFEMFLCWDGQTGNMLSNEECTRAAVANCGTNIVTQPNDPDCAGL